MIYINERISLEDNEVDLSAMRAQGAGGQNVNKVSSAIHLRFDIPASSLSDTHKQRLLDSNDSRITKEGILVIKAQQFRTQEKNKADAFERLQEFITKATHVNPTRRPTKPSRNARRKRVDQKTQRGKTKLLRGKVDY
ncbi:alternative ribosome rescue aminoacyl-tRNA hydrolase ArfB [Psychrobacter arenosus]|uniref:alternative ribosome rescue aminoacyl-tRNA hydrolase ArfB n=1 Tax=Psychrobacter arenosus TaxID=256326 RepID=UPI001917CDD7|nr:alternative ribosome rescue aminoacyl-tRNA hydrolase ArfB [Psychrobacter arenosus]